MRLTSIRQQLHNYQVARTLLASNHTTVAERKEAIAVRDDFMASAPNYVDELIAGIDQLIADTDGEECHDPYSCSEASPRLMCSRCKLRDLMTLDHGEPLPAGQYVPVTDYTR